MMVYLNSQFDRGCIGALDCIVSINSMNLVIPGWIPFIYARQRCVFATGIELESMLPIPREASIPAQFRARIP
eukprot:gene26435-biopygen16452